LEFDECGLFVNPVLLGSGIPMFKDITHQLKLAFISNKTFASGVTFLHYKRER
jgi:hypothetical protein